jgi:hypothetical protein
MNPETTELQQEAKHLCYELAAASKLWDEPIAQEFHVRRTDEMRLIPQFDKLSIGFTAMKVVQQQGLMTYFSVERTIHNTLVHEELSWGIKTEMEASQRLTIGEEPAEVLKLKTSFDDESDEDETEDEYVIYKGNRAYLIDEDAELNALNVKARYIEGIDRVKRQAHYYVPNLLSPMQEIFGYGGAGALADATPSDLSSLEADLAFFSFADEYRSDMSMAGVSNETHYLHILSYLHFLQSGIISSELVNVDDETEQ